MNIYLILFLEFFKTGLFSVGGGMATVPFLREIGEKYEWFTMNELADMIAVSESTPGPIGINMATYAGYKAAGIFGSVIATFSLILPSVVIICIVAKCLQRFRNSFLVESSFYGLRSSTIGLMAGVTVGILSLSFFQTEVMSVETFDIKALLMFVTVTVAVFAFKKINPIFIILAGAAAGIVLKL